MAINLTNFSEIISDQEDDGGEFVHYLHISLNFFLTFTGLAINVYFSRFLLRKKLINPNLKLLLHCQTVFACLACVLGFFASVRSTIALVFQMKHPILFNVSCVLFGMSLFFCLQVLVSLEIAVMLERCYASIMYLKYFDVSKTRYSVLAVLIAIVSNLIDTFMTQKSIAWSSIRGNDQLELICFDQDDGSSSNIVLRLTISLCIDLVCISACCINFLVNRYRLKNLLWYNQSQFNLKTRIQLSENIIKNKSILAKFLTFLPITILVFVMKLMELKISTSRMTKIDNYLSGFLDFDSTILLAYTSLGPAAFLLANKKERMRLAKIVKNLIASWWLKIFGENKVHPEPGVAGQQQKIFDTNKYFEDLQNAWK